MAHVKDDKKWTPDEWWTATFGKEERVKRDVFMEKYQSKVKTTDAYTVRALAKYVIRGFEPDEGYVLSKEFAHFVARFGPIDSSFVRAKASLFDSQNYLLGWFHGALSRMEAEKRLKNYEDSHGSSFLIRFSEKYPAKLTVMYISKQVIKNILVHNASGSFKLRDKDNADGSASPTSPTSPSSPSVTKDVNFANLVELIEEYKAKLGRLVPSPILAYIKEHDKPGSAPTGYTIPDFYKEQRYKKFPDFNKRSSSPLPSAEAKEKYKKMTNPPSPARRPSTGTSGHDTQSPSTHERRPSGANDPKRAGYVTFTAGDPNHLAAPHS